MDVVTMMRPAAFGFMCRTGPDGRK